ncbi:DMT family transporter [Falsiroseomonas oryzae]|uniref:DMT family transporter n=1 Tax=Falsiroseomonas oryzae TaxID=2766473 RepID=UPI0022EACFD3|nr:DMT family transporter [Roseomonas sp. MO-31]
MTPPDTAGPASANRRAILLLLAAAATFTLAAASVKALEGAIPLAQVIMARNLFALPILLLLVPRSGGLAALRPRAPGLHALRTLFGMTGMVGAFAAYTYLPLATATVLGFTMPLFLTALSVVVLRERVGWRRWTAVMVGFAGVVLVARPGADQAALPLVPVLLALLGGLGWALAMMSIRRLGEAGEPGVTIVIWFAIGSALASGLATLPVWVDPTPRQWALLVGIGVVSAVAQLLMTEAYRRGETTLLAPFEYSALLWTMLLGGAIWGEWPGPVDLLGFAVLVGAGLFIWWREVRLGVRR